MREYKMKMLWRIVILSIALGAVAILIGAWMESANEADGDGRVLTITVGLVPFILLWILVSPRLKIRLSEDEIQLVSLRVRTIAFVDLTAFEVYDGSVLLVSPNAKISISREFENQWEIADYVASRMVDLGKITREDYAALRRSFPKQNRHESHGE